MCSLARGAAVQRDLASRALLGPLGAFVIGTRLARRVVAFSGALLKCLGLFAVFGHIFLDISEHGDTRRERQNN